MQFAVNYSTQLQNLLEKDHLPVDLIKCPEWDGIIAQSNKFRPVYVHFDILLGLGLIQSLDFGKIRSLIALTDTRHLNAHLVASPDMDPSSKADNLHLLKIWENELYQLSAAFGIRNIAVENFPFMPYQPYQKMAVNADNIAQIVHSTGCGFLLDLAHARISSQVLGLNAQNYIESLPVDRLVEMHITGVKSYNGYLTDHFELQEADWQFAQWAIANIKSGHWQEPHVVAFEYGGVGEIFAWRTSQAVLETQIPRMAQLISS
jgi:uncharacterized protein (UPF0276 family)